MRGDYDVIIALFVAVAILLVIAAAIYTTTKKG